MAEDINRDEVIVEKECDTVENELLAAEKEYIKG